MNLSLPVLLMVIIAVVPAQARDQLDAIRHHVRAAAMAMGCREPRIEIASYKPSPEDFEITATCAAPMQKPAK